MVQSCRACQLDFSITDSDLEFYTKIAVPLPTHCPSCRLQRRLAWRNERQLYRRTCSLCARSIVAMFSVDAPFPVYCADCWWSDKWDPASYGQDIDWSRPFFEQFHELQQRVPKAAVIGLNNENSEYNSLLAYSKNAYMSPGSYNVEDCYYVRKSQYCKDCINANALDHCELVATSTNCRNCYQSHHLLNCRDCVQSAYLADCTGCTDCFMCSGLTTKKFCFKNTQLTEVAYRAKVAEYSSKSQAAVLEEFLAFNRTIPKRYQNQLHCQDSSGDYLYDSNQAHNCYDCFDIQDSKNLVECVNVKDSMDLTAHDKNIELCYEICTGGESNYNTKFSYCVIAANNSDYMYSCFYLTDSFGCDGFHTRAANHILNKAYSPEQYATLRAKLVDHMKQTGEYGEFFPIALSPFAYNESVVQDHFPLTQEQALAKGYRWVELTEVGTLKATPVGGRRCAQCGNDYKCIDQELKRYQQLGLTEPELCSTCRFAQLLSWKNPRQLWQRSCRCTQSEHGHSATCPIQFDTTYAPNRPELVYCEACYTKTTY